MTVASEAAAREALLRDTPRFHRLLWLADTFFWARPGRAQLLSAVLPGVAATDDIAVSLQPRGRVAWAADHAEGNAEELGYLAVLLEDPEATSVVAPLAVFGLTGHGVHAAAIVYVRASPHAWRGYFLDSAGIGVAHQASLAALFEASVAEQTSRAHVATAPLISLANEACPYLPKGLQGSSGTCQAWSLLLVHAVAVASPGNRRAVVESLRSLPQRERDARLLDFLLWIESRAPATIFPTEGDNFEDVQRELLVSQGLAAARTQPRRGRR